MDGERSNEGINVLRKESLGPTSLVLETGAHFFSDLPGKGGLYGEVPEGIKLKIVFFGRPNKITGFTKCQILRIEEFHDEIKSPQDPKRLNAGEGPKSWSIEPLKKIYCPTEELEKKVEQKEKENEENRLESEKRWEEMRQRDREIIKDLERIKELRGKLRKPWVPEQREEIDNQEVMKKEKDEGVHKEEWLPYKDEDVPMPKKRGKKS
jgi:hypothetical protein